MASHSYLNFDLSIERYGDHYRARVLQSCVGEGSVHFVLPFSTAELEYFTLKMSHARHGEARGSDSDEMVAAKAFGAKLFGAVFQGDVYACLRASLEESRAKEQGLRVLLRLPPELTNLPWEYLYNPAWNQFFSLSVETPLVRYIELTPTIHPLAVKPPLRLLVVISSPSDYDALDVECEWRDLQTALQPLVARGAVVVERLENASLLSLQRQLRRSEYHIFHFIGHGIFDKNKQDGLLIFTDEEGNGRPVDGQSLGTMLHDHRSLRLAILNACEGARTGKDDSFAGVAHSLVQMGLPAVIAMQSEISDSAANLFAQEFYMALADGYGVDAALSDARKTIFTSEDSVEWGTPVLFSRTPDGRIFDLAPARELTSFGSPPVPADDVQERMVGFQPKQIFICYKRNDSPEEPDEHLADHLYKALTLQGHTVFIDKTIRTGTNWLDEIDRKIQNSDCLIVLLSEASANSQMVKSEVMRANDYHKFIFPVRVRYEGLLPYSLAAFLNPLQYVSWQSPDDNNRVTEEILTAIQGNLPDKEPVKLKSATAQVFFTEDGLVIHADDDQPHPPLPEFDPRFLEDLEEPGGTVKLRDRLYIKRDADERLFKEILKPGTTTTIRAARQTGKSSLLVRGLALAREKNFKTVFVDVQSAGVEFLKDSDTFARYLAGVILHRTNLDIRKVDEFWQGPLGPQDKLTALMEDYVLPESNAPVLLAMDEVDRLLRVTGTSTLANDFFSLMRAWHNSRAYNEQWERLSMIMVISTEPDLLIRDIHQSPFNVGLRLYLKDFNEIQTNDLNARHGSLIHERDFHSFTRLLGGHPYLIRKALYTLLTERMSWTELDRIACDDHGPFGDHLRHYHWLLRNEPDLRSALRGIIREERCPDETLVFRLLRAGLIKSSGDVCRCRCDLYRLYFKDKL